MPTISTHIQLRLSGGSVNASPILSLGGTMSSVQVPPALYDDVTAAEAAAGRTEFRTIYATNTSVKTAKDVRAWVVNNTPSPSTVLEIGLGTSGMNGTEATQATEGAVPPGVTFVPAATLAEGLLLGDIPASQKRAIILRWTTTADTAARTSDPATVRLDWSFEE